MRCRLSKYVSCEICVSVAKTVNHIKCSSRKKGRYLHRIFSLNWMVIFVQFHEVGVAGILTQQHFSWLGRIWQLAGCSNRFLIFLCTGGRLRCAWQLLSSGQTCAIPLPHSRVLIHHISRVFYAHACELNWARQNALGRSMTRIDTTFNSRIP